MQPSSQKKKKSDAAYEPARIKIDFAPSHQSLPNLQLSMNKKTKRKQQIT